MKSNVVGIGIITLVAFIIVASGCVQNADSSRAQAEKIHSNLFVSGFTDSNSFKQQIDYLKKEVGENLASLRAGRNSATDKNQFDLDKRITLLEIVQASSSSLYSTRKWATETEGRAYSDFKSVSEIIAWALMVDRLEYSESGTLNNRAIEEFKNDDSAAGFNAKVFQTAISQANSLVAGQGLKAEKVCESDLIIILGNIESTTPSRDVKDINKVLYGGITKDMIGKIGNYCDEISNQFIEKAKNDFRNAGSDAERYVAAERILAIKRVLIDEKDSITASVHGLEHL